MTEKFTPGLAFGFLTPFYDSAVNFLGFGRPFLRRLLHALQMANIRGDERALDIGCGSGTLIIELKRQYPGMNVTGMDPDTKMIKVAEAKLKKAGIPADLVHGFAQKLPFPDSHFDLATSTLVFHHLPTEIKRQGIAEIRRVLKPGGTFLLADFGKPGNVMMHVLLHFGSIFDGQSRMRDNLQGKMPILLQEAGFEVTEIRPGYRGVQFLLAKTRRPEPHPPPNIDSRCA